MHCLLLTMVTQLASRRLKSKPTSAHHLHKSHDEHHQSNPGGGAYFVVLLGIANLYTTLLNKSFRLDDCCGSGLWLVVPYQRLCHSEGSWRRSYEQRLLESLRTQSFDTCPSNSAARCPTWSLTSFHQQLLKLKSFKSCSVDFSCTSGPSSSMRHCQVKKVSLGRMKVVTPSKLPFQEVHQVLKLEPSSQRSEHSYFYDLILHCKNRSQKKAFSADFVLLKIRSCNARSDLKNKSVIASLGLHTRNAGL